MQSKMYEIKCSHCESSWMVKCETIINAQNEKKLKSLILNESFFTRKCSKCGTLISFYYPFLYCDMKKKYLLAIKGENRGWIEDLNSLSQYQDFKKRIVENIDELKEKIIIFDNDLNDIVIGNIKEQIKNNYEYLFFESKDKENLLWFNTNQGLIAIEGNFYQEKEDTNKKFVEIK